MQLQHNEEAVWQTGPYNSHTQIQLVPSSENELKSLSQSTGPMLWFTELNIQFFALILGLLGYFKKKCFYDAGTQSLKGQDRPIKYLFIRESRKFVSRFLLGYPLLVSRPLLSEASLTFPLIHLLLLSQRFEHDKPKSSKCHANINARHFLMSCWDYVIRYTPL